MLPLQLATFGELAVAAVPDVAEGLEEFSRRELNLGEVGPVIVDRLGGAVPPRG